MFITYNKLAASSKTEVDAVQYKKLEDSWTQIERNQQVTTEDERRTTHDCRQEIRIAN